VQISLQSFDVSLSPEQPARLISTDSHRWALHSLRPNAESVGAIVVEGPDVSVHCFDWNKSTAVE
jgi:hypothetical protein